MNAIKVQPKQEEKTVRDLIELARDVVSSSTTTISDENNNKTGSFLSLLQLFDTSLNEISTTLESNFSHLHIWKHFDPTSLYYYLEYEDSVKTPSWKRRVHRYHDNVDVQDVRKLNEELYLAELAYADSVDEIREGLNKYGWELAYCQIESLPGKPSHYLALRSSPNNSSSPYLDVLLVARGTKTLSDIFTDAMLDTTTYRNGVAHAGVLKSGLYLSNRHIGLIQTLQKASKKHKVRMTLIGHSLGAGAVTIAGMEFRKLQNNHNNDYDVSVTGFGCPALVSKDLSEEMKDFVTTVIVDSDVIPRMSAASIANVMLDVMEYDWTDFGRRDVRQALEELSNNAPAIFKSSSSSSSGVKEAMNMVNRVIDKYIRPSIKSPTTERMTPVLFPPGTCIHFYRDGRGISGSRAPCDFFGEVDVTRTMLDDHTIDDGYRRIFLDLMREVRKDQHFSFDDDGDDTKSGKKK